MAIPRYKALEILEEVQREWTLDKYCTGTLAENINGMSVEPLDHSAVCWCFIGAMYKAAHVLYAKEKHDASVTRCVQSLIDIVRQVTGDSVSYTSDVKKWRGAQEAIKVTIASLRY